MSSEKPDQPWQMRGATPGFVEPSPYPTRLRAALAGMWRGAKIGFWVLAVPAWFLEVAFFLMGGTMAWAPDGHWAISLAKLSEFLMVSVVVTPLVALLCGSLSLGLLLGLIEARNWQGAEEADS